MQFRHHTSLSVIDITTESVKGLELRMSPILLDCLLRTGNVTVEVSTAHIVLLCPLSV